MVDTIPKVFYNPFIDFVLKVSSQIGRIIEWKEKMSRYDCPGVIIDVAIFNEIRLYNKFLRVGDLKDKLNEQSNNIIILQKDNENIEFSYSLGSSVGTINLKYCDLADRYSKLITIVNNLIGEQISYQRNLNSLVSYFNYQNLVPENKKLLQCAINYVYELKENRKIDFSIDDKFIWSSWALEIFFDSFGYHYKDKQIRIFLSQDWNQAKFIDFFNYYKKNFSPGGSYRNSDKRETAIEHYCNEWNCFIKNIQLILIILDLDINLFILEIDYSF